MQWRELCLPREFSKMAGHLSRVGQKFVTISIVSSTTTIEIAEMIHVIHHNHCRNHRNGPSQPLQKSQKWSITTIAEITEMVQHNIAEITEMVHHNRHRFFFSLAATKVTSSNYLSFCPQGAHVSVSLVVIKYSIVIMYCTSIGKTNVGKTPLVRLPTEWPSLRFGLSVKCQQGSLLQ
jgi:hypothetical protein